MRAHDVAVREIRATLAKLIPVTRAYEDVRDDVEIMDRAEKMGALWSTEKRTKLAARLTLACSERDDLLSEIHRIARLWPKAWAAVVRVEPATVQAYARPVETAALLARGTP